MEEFGLRVRDVYLLKCVRYTWDSGSSYCSFALLFVQVYVTSNMSIIIVVVVVELRHHTNHVMFHWFEVKFSWWYVGLNEIKLSTWLVRWRSSTTTIIVIDAST